MTAWRNTACPPAAPARRIPARCALSRAYSRGYNAHRKNISSYRHRRRHRRSAACLCTRRKNVPGHCGYGIPRCLRPSGRRSGSRSGIQPGGPGKTNIRPPSPSAAPPLPPEYRTAPSGSRKACCRSSCTRAGKAVRKRSAMNSMQKRLSMICMTLICMRLRDVSRMPRLRPSWALTIA